MKPKKHDDGREKWLYPPGGYGHGYGFLRACKLLALAAFLWMLAEVGLCVLRALNLVPIPGL